MRTAVLRTAATGRAVNDVTDRKKTVHDASGHAAGEQAGKEISVAGAALGVFLIVAVPVLIGLVLRRFAESFALRFEPVARKGSAVLCREMVSAEVERNPSPAT